MHNVPVTINGRHDRPAGIISLDDMGYEFVREFFRDIQLSIRKDLDRNELVEFNLIIPPSVPADMPQQTTSIGVDSPISDTAVSLICRAGHIIGWPKVLYPRPERCMVIIDVKATVKEYCNQKVYNDLQLVPDVKDGEYGEKLNPHPVTQRDFDLRLVALAAVGYLAFMDGAEHAENYKAQINPQCLAESLDRLSGA